MGGGKMSNGFAENWGKKLTRLHLKFGQFCRGKKEVGQEKIERPYGGGVNKHEGLQYRSLSGSPFQWGGGTLAI